FELTFQDERGETQHAWNTSWGVSTRLVGGHVMTHGDDTGLRTPPKLAPIEVVVVPIWKSDDERGRLLDAAYRVRDDLKAWNGRGDDRIRVQVDAREGIKPGAKYYEWELRGVPLRLELGPRDLSAGTCVAVRRDTRAKEPISLTQAPDGVARTLATMQGDMLKAAVERREANSVRGPITYHKFREIMEGTGAFVYAGWCGDPDVEAKVKEETKATIRVIPDPEFRSPEPPTTCLYTGKPAKHEVVWARAY
ncbi:MAG: proline--tRNA ligase, partial [Gemmatimonadaceae bacterium]